MYCNTGIYLSEQLENMFVKSRYSTGTGIVGRKPIQELELRRVGKFFFMGSCIVAPCIRTWLLTLDKLVKLQGNKIYIAVFYYFYLGDLVAQ
jgi:hypothetical protein